jgi:hypothetical protein
MIHISLYISVTQISKLLLFYEIIAIYSELIRNIYYTVLKNAEFLMLKQLLHIVTITL